MAAEGATKEKSEDKKEAKKDEKKPFTPPSLDPSTPAPIFGGSTGGLLRKAQVLKSALPPVSFIEARSQKPEASVLLRTSLKLSALYTADANLQPRLTYVPLLSSLCYCQMSLTDIGILKTSLTRQAAQCNYSNCIYVGGGVLCDHLGSQEGGDL